MLSWALAAAAGAALGAIGGFIISASSFDPSHIYELPGMLLVGVLLGALGAMVGAMLGGFFGAFSLIFLYPLRRFGGTRHLTLVLTILVGAIVAAFVTRSLFVSDWSTWDEAWVSPVLVALAGVFGGVSQYFAWHLAAKRLTPGD